MPITPITPSGPNAPNDLPSDAAGAVSVPNTLNADAAGSVAVPNTLPADAAGTVAVPNTLPADAAGTVAAPNTLPADAAGTVAAPNTLSADAAGSIAAPTSLPSQGAAGFPRSLTPMVDFDFAAKSYTKNGVAIAFDDIFTYTRASSASFINRRAKQHGGYEYFLDTDYVGDVTNLCLRSEEIGDTPWGNISLSYVSSASIAPDNTLSATKITFEDDASARSQQYVATTIGSAYTWSVWMKAGTKNLARLELSASNSGSVTVELTSDWKRFSITGVATGTDVYPRIKNLSGAGNIYAWGAQVTESDKPLPYVKTVDTSVTKTFAETLRVEYDAATGKNLGALIEAPNTNLCVRSEEFTTSNWINQNLTVSANTIIAPDDTLSADLLLTLSDNLTKSIRQDVTIVSGVEYATSIFAKAGGKRYIQLSASSGGFGTNFANFDLQTGTITKDDANGASIRDMGNGWFRVSMQQTAISTGTSPIYFALVNSGTSNRLEGWNGDGTGLYVWGAQFEVKDFPTSYIRTEGGSVTRTKDTLTVNGFNLNNEEFSVVTNFSKPYIVSQGGISSYKWSVTDGSSVNRVISIITNKRTRIVKTDNNSHTADFSSSFYLLGGNASYSDAVIFKNSGINGYLNGALYGSDSNTPVNYTNFDNLNIGSRINGTFSLNGHISKFTTYAQALTQQEITLL